MANKTLPASTGYFNKKMLDILAKGESKSAPKSSGVKNTPKAAPKPKSK